jgi:hypothetical protein
MKLNKEQLRRQWDANRLIRVELDNGEELVVAKGDFTDREVHFAVGRPEDRTPTDISIALGNCGLTWPHQLQSPSFENLFVAIQTAVHLLEDRRKGP